LHPFIRTIAERSGNIDLTPLQTTADHGSILPMLGFSGTRTTLSNTHPALMALIQGEKDVVFSARRLSLAEVEEAGTLGNELVYIPFAKDAFVFLQNRHNPVRNMTVEQYQRIFSGQYKNWKEVGGFGGDIQPFIRNAESGSEELMQTLVMRDVPIHEDFKPKKLSSMGVVFEELESSLGGISYSIYHYDRYMVFNAHTRVIGVNGIFPNAETIASGKYPLVYECVLVHRKNPGKTVERFVRWLLSEEGQQLVRSVGYVPIRE
jgi:phosphate transport system substrate-binding protein